MTVDPSEVLRIAALARLDLDDEEREALTADLNAILDHVDALGGIDDEAADEPGGPDAPPSTRQREETPERDAPVSPAASAPAWREGFFLVPHPPGVQADGEDA